MGTEIGAGPPVAEVSGLTMLLFAFDTILQIHEQCYVPTT